MDETQNHGSLSETRTHIRNMCDISIDENLDYHQFQSFLTGAVNYISNCEGEKRQQGELVYELCLNELAYHAQRDSIRDSYLLLNRSLDLKPSESTFYSKVLFENNKSTFAQAFSCLFEASLPKISSQKTVACFYRSTSGGGASNVMKDLALRWKRRGHGVVVIAERIPDKDLEFFLSQDIACEVIISDSDDSYSHLAELETILTKHSIDYFVYHEWHRANLLWDLTLSRLLEIPFVIFCHGTFSYKLDLLDPYFAEMPSIFALANGIITLSSTDQQFWSLFNSNCFQTVNSAKYKPISQDALASHPKQRVLWLGRKAREKHPEEAAKIFVEVHKIDPNISFDFIGSEKNKPLANRVTKILSGKLTEPILNRKTWTD